ncbi:O-antigen ligase family protein [Rhizobium sp. BK376]|uniref:O-antigen ligase family protein n=1 Tax=Rhizobium sp. BK376 TaxID=2512149 RepID=UPI00104CCD8D|nr:O-antigen ligase family protein [Rhizobium sp. BK376]TCR63206.1 hypothetical protein EV561_1726 [Rhizobium sp. BK376]
MSVVENASRRMLISRLPSRRYSTHSFNFLALTKALSRWGLYGYVVRELIGGPLRYYASSAGVGLVNYIPPAFTCISLFVYIYYSFLTGRMCKSILLFLIFLIIFSAYIPFTLITLPQALFGIYILIPIINGMLLYSLGDFRSIERYAFVFWTIAVAGVFINSVYTLPWAGGSYEILGIQREIARDWEYEGYSRIAGFGRSSFATANIILVYMIIITASKLHGNIIKVSATVISFISIYLTTTKTTFIVLASLPLFMISISIVNRLLPRLTYIYVVLSLSVMIAIMTALPIFSQTFDVNSQSSFGIFSFESLSVRLKIVWPYTFQVLSHGGNLLFGRGLGGVGVPQQIFEEDYFTFADNLFLYILLSFGIFGITFVYIGFVKGYKELLSKRPRHAYLVYLFSVYIIGTGMTSNTIEGPMQAILIGVILAKAVNTGNLLQRVPK